MRRLFELVAPVVLVLAVGAGGTVFSRSTQEHFKTALIYVAVVVALYVFIGNSGVLSFGHASFVAVGAWTAGLVSVPVQEKQVILPDLFPFLRDAHYGNVQSLALAAVAGGLFALVVGLPLMRLAGLAAGIATFAVLEITHNVLRFWTEIGPGPNTWSSVPETTDLRQATIGALVVIGVAYLYQRSRPGRLLRATREDPAAAQAVGVSVYRQRLLAFTLSGALAGLAGGLYIHLLILTTEQVYLELTFITLAMLVIGGATSLWGAVVGAIFVSGLDSFLGEAEAGTVAGLDLPEGTRLIVVGVLMALILILRPSGISGGRELGIRRARNITRGATTEAG